MPPIKIKNKIITTQKKKLMEYEGELYESFKNEVLEQVDEIISFAEENPLLKKKEIKIKLNHMKRIKYLTIFIEKFNQEKHLDIKIKPIKLGLGDPKPFFVW